MPVGLIFLNIPTSNLPNFHFQTRGGDMATKRLKLTFPQDLIKEPVIFTMAKKFEIMPNIRRAKVTESVGEVVLELEGAEKELDAGIAYLKERGVKVEAVESSEA
jgi:ABC-type methionine transport system ATPase subunit